MQLDLENWTNTATVRSREPIVIEDYPGQEQRFPFPRVKLPISFHPAIARAGPDVQRELLTQGCYRFLEEIAGIEECIVIQTSTQVLRGEYLPGLDSRSLQSLRIVCIDEHYHSAQAFDYMRQLKGLAGVEQLPFSSTNTWELMGDIGSEIASPDVRAFFDINVLCLVENTITSSLLDFMVDDRCHDSFNELNRSHIVDESRHGAFFRELLTYAYEDTELLVQQEVARPLARFIRESLGTVRDDRRFAQLLLEEQGMSPGNIEQVLDDSYPNLTHANFNAINMAAEQNLKLLRNFEVFRRADVRKAFNEYELAL